MKTVTMLYGREGMDLRVPDRADVLEGQHVAALADEQAAVRAALAAPIGCGPLREVVRRRGPANVAITVSDITRPVPNRLFLPAMLDELNAAGVDDPRIIILIGTGMHRPSTPQEQETIVGSDVLKRVRVVDHRSDQAHSLVRISDDPPVSVCRLFAQADFRIVTGYIEPHFMAGFSGGRKGVCPALVDLATVQRFHGYATLAHPLAENGVLQGNPCHEISLSVARAVGVDFLFNVAVTRQRRIAGIYCGELEQAHLAGCREVAAWTTAKVDRPYDLVVTCGGGWPLDQTFYQSVKGMCTAVPALGEDATMLVVSHCGEGVGSRAYSDLMRRWNNDWRGFLADIASHPERTQLDQWQFQMQARVLERIGTERLCLACDSLPMDVQRCLAVRPVSGEGDARARAQQFIDSFIQDRPKARVAIIPDGPYTMLTRPRGGWEA